MKRVVCYGINNVTEAYIGYAFARNNYAGCKIDTFENDLERVLALDKGDCDVVVVYAQPASKDGITALKIKSTLSGKKIKVDLIM